MNINKIVRIGTQADTGDTFCKISFDGKRLNIVGVEGPKHNGDCRGACGQIVMHLKPGHFASFAPGWDAARCTMFLTIWDKWHLSDLRAGSPAQEKWLEANPLKPESTAHPNSHYEAASKALAAAGLNPDPSRLYQGKPYKYGSAWLFEEVPQYVLDFLVALPESDTVPAWV